MKERAAPIDATELRALERKYRTLAAWRRARDADRTRPVDRAALRALAAEFPGALRELDLLGIAEIERRVKVLVSLVGPRSVDGDEAGGEDEDEDGADDWIRWIAAFHRLMRVALAIRRNGRRSPSHDEALALAGEVEAAEGMQVEAELVTLMARPPGGRLAVLVLREIGRRFGVPPARVAARLFPPRRAPPYRL